MSLQYITNNAGALQAVVIPIERSLVQNDHVYSSRLIQAHILVPNMRDSNFIDECKRQTASLYDDPQEKEILDWIGTASCQKGWK